MIMPQNNVIITNANISFLIIVPPFELCTQITHEESYADNYSQLRCQRLNRMILIRSLIAVFRGHLTEMVAHCGESKPVGNVAGMKPDDAVNVVPKGGSLAIENAETQNYLV
jgi:hypothetical protein